MDSTKRCLKTNTRSFEHHEVENENLCSGFLQQKTILESRSYRLQADSK